MIKTFYNVDQDLHYSKFDALLKKIKSGTEIKSNGIFISGNPGVGKTTFVKWFLKNINATSKEFLKIDDWISKYQKSWKAESFEGIYIEQPKNLATKKILIIDDLGSEYIHSSTAPYIQELLEFRYEFCNKNKNTLTIFTSNFSFEKIEKTYSKNSDREMGKRIISRLKGIVNLWIAFEGNDKRIKDSEVIDKRLGEVIF